MARKPTSPEIINQVKRLIAQGMNYSQIGVVIGKSQPAVKWMCYRNNIYKRKVVNQVENEFCYLSDKQLDANVKALVAEYGIKNSLVCRKASELEIRQLNIKTSKYTQAYNQPPSCQS